MAYAIFIFCIFSVPSAIAHSPLISVDNGRLNEAMFISDPLIMGDLWRSHEGREVDYYRFEIEKGKNIYKFDEARESRR